MKRIKLILLFIGINILAFAASSAITGGFYEDKGYIFFEGQNISNQAIKSIQVTCVNESKQGKEIYTITDLKSKDYFEIGPNQGWVWEKGEKLIVTYQSGQSMYWEYQQSINEENKATALDTLNQVLQGIEILNQIFEESQAQDNYNQEQQQYQQEPAYNNGNNQTENNYTNQQTAPNSNTPTQNNSPQPTMKEKTCSSCHGTGVRSSPSTTSCGGQSYEHWCNDCHRMVPCSHGAHPTCGACRGTRVEKYYGY